MTADHETSERVYTALKADLLAGRFLPGRLQITTLEGRYRASATPVREALLRLVGERLVEMRPTGGFALPVLDEEEVRGLYEINLRLILLAIAWRDAHEAELESSYPTEHTLEPPIDILFNRLAREVSNGIFASIIDSINDRLHRIRRVEQEQLEGLDDEFINLERLVRQGPAGSLKRAVQSYHRRRLNHVSGIMTKILLQDAEKIRWKS